MSGKDVFTGAASHLTNSDTLHETLFDSLTRNDTINLNIGAPSQDLLEKAAEVWSRSTNGPSSAFFQYGPQLGHSEVLKDLATFLANMYKSPVDAAELCLTNGCSQAFFNCISLFATPQTTIILHQPTYFLAMESLKDHPIDFKVVGASSNLTSLDSFLSSSAPSATSKEGRFPFIFYCNPTFANPTGETMTLEFRKQLIGLAYKHNMLLICDDVYDMLSYSDAELPPRLVSLDQGQGRVLSLGTLSKIFAPGSRMGWVEARAPLIQRIEKSGLLASGGGSVQLLAFPLQNILRELPQHIQHLRQVYKQRMDFLLFQLTQQIDLNIQVLSPTPAGGFFVWVRLPPGMDAVKLRNYALSRAKPVGFAPGAWFAPAPSIDSTKESFSEFVRLSFTFYNLDELKEGVRRLADAITEYSKIQ